MAISDLQLEKYADVLIWALKKGRGKNKISSYENILVRYHTLALPLVEILHRKLIQKRMNVILRSVSGHIIERNFFKYADQKQLKFISAGQKQFLNSVNGYIVINAPSSLNYLKDITPKKMAVSALSKKTLRDIMDMRENKGKLSWTLCTYPTEALSKQAGMSISEYEKQIQKACFLDKADPIKKWEALYKQAQEIKKWLFSLNIKSVRIQSNFVDLQINIGEKRKFVGLTGHNIPSFEIYTSPDWRSTKGVYYADQPCYRSGNIIKGIKLWFEKGIVVKAKANEGEKFLLGALNTDKGSKKIGELSLTDRNFSPIDKFMANTLYDENYGGKFGNCHIAIGHSFSDTFSENPQKLTPALKKLLGFNTSVIHWDLVNTENKTVTAVLKNGKKTIIYEKGVFKY